MTRMPVAPASRSGTRMRWTSLAPTTAWTAMHALVGERQHAGRLQPGQDGLDGLERAVGAFIIRYFTPRPAMTASIIVRTSAMMAAAAGRDVPAADQDGLAGEERAHRAQAVHDQRRAAGDEVDDAVGEAHRGCHLDRAR